MALGFNVESLAGSARGAGALRIGLARVEEADWLIRDFDPAARARGFAAHPNSIAIMPGAQKAAGEAAHMVAQCDDFALAAHRVWEDLCVLEEVDGQYRLTAAALAFPTDWHLAEKLGHGLDAIHAPIHGYADQLASGVNRFMAQLAPGPIFGRANWFVVETPDWRYAPKNPPETRFAHITPDNAGTRLFIRCERQTLRRMPDSGAVLFTIGIVISPLDGLSLGLCQRIAAAISALDGGEGERRAAPHYAQALADYAMRRAELENN
jgi:hypothetical protein